LVPETLLFLPLFKMFAVFHEWTGIELINRWYVNEIIVGVGEEGWSSHQNRIRDSAKAAGTLISIVMLTTRTDTTTELRKKVRNCVEDTSAT
jgi:hypothetical protein